MVDKMTCPGCNSRTSDVLRAFEEGDNCPYCGLSAQAAGEVAEARRRHADEELTERLAEAIVARDRAVAEVHQLRSALDTIRSAVRSADVPSRTT